MDMNGMEGIKKEVFILRRVEGIGLRLNPSCSLSAPFEPGHVTVSSGGLADPTQLLLFLPQASRLGGESVSIF